MADETHPFMCRRTVRYNGKRYGRDEPVEMPMKDANPLLDRGALEEMEDGETRAGAPAPVEASVDAAAAVIPGLKAEHYTKGGKPRPEAIAAAIEGDVTVSGKTRDDAFVQAKLVAGFKLPDGVKAI